MSLLRFQRRVVFSTTTDSRTVYRQLCSPDTTVRVAVLTLSYVCSHQQSSAGTLVSFALVANRSSVGMDLGHVDPQLAPIPIPFVESAPGQPQRYWRLSFPIQPAVGDALKRHRAGQLAADRCSPIVVSAMTLQRPPIRAATCHSPAPGGRCPTAPQRDPRRECNCPSPPRHAAARMALCPNAGRVARSMGLQR